MKREEAIYCLKAQSERYSEVCEECPLYGQTGVDHCCEDASFERFGCDTGMGGELVVNMDDVIEIVKAGGADGN